LVVRLKLDVFIGLSFFDYAFEIDRKLLAGLPRQFHFSLVREITEAARPDDRLTNGITFVGRNFLRTLALDRAIDINSPARFFADSVDRENDSRMIVIFFLEQGFDRVSKFLARLATGGYESNVRDF